MKRLLFVNNSLEFGGAERVLVDLVNALSNKGYEVDLFTLYSSNTSYETLLSDKVGHKYIFKKRGKLFNKIALNILCRIIPRKRLYKKVIKKDYDCIIAFLQGFPTEFVRLAPVSSQKITFVHSDFSNNYDVEALYKTKEACHSAYKQFDKVCFVSQTAQKGFEKAIGALDNGYLVYNLINNHRILQQSKVQTEVRYSDNVFRLITVGRLIKLKAMDRIVEAVDYARLQGKAVECFIVGDGPERENLEGLIADKNLQPFIKVLGYQDNPYKYVVNADMYICSSKTEGYSTTAVEALILGVPILTTNVSGMKEIIGETNCGVITDNTDDALKLKLNELLEDPIQLKQMKSAARLRGDSFGMEKRLQEFINMLNE